MPRSIPVWQNPPTLEDVRAYVAEKNVKVSPDVFVNYFDASSWVDSQ
jgi:hypothetical protein